MTKKTELEKRLDFIFERLEKWDRDRIAEKVEAVIARTKSRDRARIFRDSPGEKKDNSEENR